MKRIRVRKEVILNSVCQSSEKFVRAQIKPFEKNGFVIITPNRLKLVLNNFKKYYYKRKESNKNKMMVNDFTNYFVDTNISCALENILFKIKNKHCLFRKITEIEDFVNEFFRHI